MKNTELEWIDFNEDFDEEKPSSVEAAPDHRKQKKQTGVKSAEQNAKRTKQTQQTKTQQAPKQKSESAEASDEKSRSFLNFHVIFLLFLVISIVFIVCRFKNWGIHINLAELMSSIIQDDEEYTYEETYDSIMPLIGEDGYGIDQTVDNILLFGNAPFADDRDSNKSLANMIAKSTKANVINLSVADSYAATATFGYEPDNHPLDLFAPYWLAEFLTGGVTKEYYSLAESYLSPERMQQAWDLYHTMESIDMNSIDVAVFMYDATDFYMDKKPSDVNLTDTTTFAGNITAAIELLGTYYPQIRFIVLSPTFAYSVDAGGNYVSPELNRNSFGPLSDYTIFECNGATTYLCVTFIDNYFGTITEQNADQYLRDNLHLNEDGRKKVLDRFLYALNYFKK